MNGFSTTTAASRPWGSLAHAATSRHLFAPRLASVPRLCDTERRVIDGEPARGGPLPSNASQ